MKNLSKYDNDLAAPTKEKVILAMRAMARSTSITRRHPTGRKTAHGICAHRDSAAPVALTELDGVVNRTGASCPRWTASQRHGASN